ncbi:hypothetical protein [Kineosporia succinea]|uniref:DUF1127 domain-containing protein n=1 Tax=Kineosporia succinea TaxID=84632 RepID=A0ABT9P9L7_9ACTN|nr:hypothetical protein [Kineosporia succinea]MDP9829390.1 hypothetical protein [Kineosporia succinea]
MEKLPASFTELLSVMIQYVELRDRLRDVRETAAGDLHELGWPAQRISDELKAQLEALNLSDSQLRSLGVSRATIDADIRSWRREQEKAVTSGRRKRVSGD